MLLAEMEELDHEYGVQNPPSLYSWSQLRKNNLAGHDIITSADKITFSGVQIVQ